MTASISAIKRNLSNNPPVTEDSIRRAIQAANDERRQVSLATGMTIPLHPVPEFQPVERSDDIRLEEHEIITRVAAHVGGWQRLATLVRNLAHYDGQDVSERPLDRCLADGGPLSDGVCVRCGRDNR